RRRAPAGSQQYETRLELPGGIAPRPRDDSARVRIDDLSNSVQGDERGHDLTRSELLRGRADATFRRVRRPQQLADGRAGARPNAALLDRAAPRAGGGGVAVVGSRTAPRIAETKVVEDRRDDDRHPAGA